MDNIAGKDSALSQQSVCNINCKLKQYVLDSNKYQECFPKLTPYGSKGKCGRPLLVVGSQKYHGAAIFASQSCQRAGADYTYLITHGEKLNVVCSSSPDIIASLYEDKNQIEQIPCTSILIGCGLDRNNSAEQLFNSTVEVTILKKVPIVVDADGLYFFQKLFQKNNDITNQALFILTPNQREFNNLFKHVLNEETQNYNQVFSQLQASNNKYQLNNMQTAIDDVVQLANRLKCCILVKNLIDICVYQNDVKISIQLGMPKRCSGQGDVLAGIVAAIINCNENIAQQVIFGCEVVKKAARLAFQENRQSTITADLIKQIPNVLYQFCNNNAQNYELEIQ